MVISKLHLDRIEKNLSLIQEYLLELGKFSALSEPDFLADKRNPAAAESYLRRALEAMFDIARHILAKSYGSKELEYKKIALELGAKGVVDESYSLILVKMAGYRNRLVHFYQEVGPEEILHIIRNYRDDIQRFIKEIAFFIEKYKKALSERK